MVLWAWLLLRPTERPPPGSFPVPLERRHRLAEGLGVDRHRLPAAGGCLSCVVGVNDLGTVLPSRVLAQLDALRVVPLTIRLADVRLEARRDELPHVPNPA